MFMVMRALQVVVTWYVVMTIVCACVMGFPAYSQTGQPDDLNNLLDELRQELHLDPKVNSMNRNGLQIASPALQQIDQSNQPSFGTFGSIGRTQPLQGSPLLSALLTKDAAEENNKFSNLGVNKRQGSWDYDYGLGGGRFGKRGGNRFSDYSLGGGRFGRDVDHVVRFDDDVIDFDDAFED